MNQIQHYLQLNKNNCSLSETTRLPELREYELEGDEHENEQMALKKTENSVSRSIQNELMSAENVVINMAKRKKCRSKLNHLEDTNALNDLFWNKYRKIPFVALAMAMSTYLILIFVHFTNLYYALFGGLVPCFIALAILLPIYCFFKKYDVSLKYKSLCIQSHIEKEEKLKDEKAKIFKKNRDLLKENENLANNLLSRYNQIQQQRKKIVDLKEIIAQKQKNKVCQQPMLDSKSSSRREKAVKSFVYFIRCK